MQWKEVKKPVMCVVTSDIKASATLNKVGLPFIFIAFTNLFKYFLSVQFSLEPCELIF